MVSVGTADGFSFSFDARVDVVGQGCHILTKKVRGVDAPWDLKMQLQKRHQKARVYMNLFSDHSDRYEICIRTNTPHHPALRDYQTIGSEGLVSWQYCCCLHRDYINCDTVWEIWGSNGVDDVILFTLSFEACVNNEQQIFAENWIEIDGTTDGSTIDSNCDAFYNNEVPIPYQPNNSVAPSTPLLKTLSPNPLRVSSRKKVLMKKRK